MGARRPTECGTLFVAQDRARPTGKSLRLAVAVLPAKQPSSVPLVMLHRGPAGAGGVRTLTRRAAGWDVARSRDIIVFDVRSARLSEPALCPEFIDAGGRARRLQTPARRRGAFASAVRACIAKLQSQGIDPAGYNTPIHAADLTSVGCCAFRRGISWACHTARPSHGKRCSTTPPEFAASCSKVPACAQAFPSLEKDFGAVFDE
jgi:hypothetical protein